MGNEEAEKLTSLFKRYSDNLEIYETSYTLQKLCERFLMNFSDLLRTCKRSNKEGFIVYNHLLDTDCAIRRVNFDYFSIEEVAYYLRKPILSGEVIQKGQ